jgi:hypothetical protein
VKGIAGRVADEVLEDERHAPEGPPRQLRLLRIRGGARLRGYHDFARELSAEEYVRRVVHGELHDATLSFQLHEGFHVLAVVPHYLEHDPETLGYAALIEWLNPDLVEPHHHADRPTEFLHRDERARIRAGASPPR